jgi:Spy/CpxP family protein refolding chaperone
MKAKILILTLALSASTFLLTAQDDNQRPAKRQGGTGGSGGESGRPGGPGGQGGFHILPPRAQEQLKLTTEQQQQVTALEAEVKAKLEKILTPDQIQQLKQMRPPQRPGGSGSEGGEQGGQGAGRRGPGGQSGQGRPQRPAQDQ